MVAEVINEDHFPFRSGTFTLYILIINQYIRAETNLLNAN